MFTRQAVIAWAADQGVIAVAPIKRVVPPAPGEGLSGIGASESQVCSPHERATVKVPPAQRRRRDVLKPQQHARLIQSGDASSGEIHISIRTLLPRHDLAGKPIRQANIEDVATIADLEIGDGGDRIIQR